MSIYICSTNQCQVKTRLLLLETGMKKARVKVIFCSKHAKTENLWCQVEMMSSCPALVFVSLNPKASKN
jgi:hypothetical protein